MSTKAKKVGKMSALAGQGHQLERPNVISCLRDINGSSVIPLETFQNNTDMTPMQKKIHQNIMYDFFCEFSVRWWSLQSFPLNHTTTVSLRYHQLTEWYHHRCVQCVRFWKEKQTAWPQQLQSWAPPLIPHLFWNTGGGVVSNLLCKFKNIT